jgi:hypothetical protein
MKIVMRGVDKIDGAGQLVKAGAPVEVSEGEGRALIAEGRADEYKTAVEAAAPTEDATAPKVAAKIEKR